MVHMLPNSLFFLPYLTGTNQSGEDQSTLCLCVGCKTGRKPYEYVIGALEDTTEEKRQERFRMEHEKLLAAMETGGQSATPRPL